MGLKCLNSFPKGGALLVTMFLVYPKLVATTILLQHLPLQSYKAKHGMMDLPIFQDRTSISENANVSSCKQCVALQKQLLHFRILIMVKNVLTTLSNWKYICFRFMLQTLLNLNTHTVDI